MSTDTQFPKFRWFVMTTMLIGAIAQGVIMIAPSPLIGEVAKYLGKDLGLVTFTVMGLWTITVCIGGIIGGVLVDKVGVIKVYLVCGLILIISAVGIPLAGKSLPAIVFLRLLGGAGTGPIISSIVRVAAEWFPSKERGLISGVQGMSTALGISVGFAASPAVFAVNHSWPETMVFMAIPSVVFIICTIIMALGPKPPTVMQINSQKIEHSTDFKRAMKDPTIYLCILYIFLFNWLVQGINDLTPGYFAIPSPVGVGFGPTTAGNLMMLFQMMYMIASLLSGWLNTKVYKGNYRIQIMLAYLITGLYYFIRFSEVTGTGPNFLLILILLITALFLGQGIATIITYIANSYPEHITGKVGGVVVGFGLFGGVIGVACGSSALTVTHTYQLSIIIVTIVTLLGFVTSFLLKARPAMVAIKSSLVADEKSS
ncbi:MFS transporter [Dehalobacter sp. DCM]|uniref:MFS transporter n=1 Tax=Dehalobacter sp. DCM TaxID=2907827 RepID=UPI003081D593|nr:MFS transporter [Dehalobacter sp. DCM]